MRLGTVSAWERIDLSVFSSRSSSYKPTRDIQFTWDTFRKGLNTLLRENEIAKDEVSQAENILLKGRGIPTKRWGTSLYYQSGNATGSVRGLRGMYYSNGTVELVAITDDGFLTLQNGSSFTRVNGASWASGYNAYMTQLKNTMYIVNGQRELVKYSSPTLVGFPTIAIPTISSASNISNATGSTIKSYRATSVSQVGETVASTSFQLGTQPASLGGVNGGVIRLVIAPASTASGILQGTNIYGRDAGYERYLGFLPGSATIFFDTGSVTPSEFTLTPTADSTGGPIAKYVERFQDRLVFAGISGEPSKLLISGRAPNQEKFDISFGGNFLEIEPDAGDNIVQIKTFSDRIIVFKQRSIWQVTLTSEQIGNFSVTTPTLKLITSSHGCIAPRSVVAVEGDVYFLSRRGVNSLGYKTGVSFDLLQSGEISLKIRTFFDGLTSSQKTNAVAVYKDKKYLLAFPGLNKTMVFDTERAAWTGPWSVDAQVFEVFFDGSNNEHLLYGNDDSVNVDEYSSDFVDDKGTAIQTILKTRQEDFGDWSLFKNIKNIFTEFRNITGLVSVDIALEQRSGSVVTAKSFNVVPNTGSSGWGADMWGSTLWGNSATAGGGSDTQQTIRWANLNKAARTMQMTINTTSANDNYELLGIRGDAKPIGSGFRPSSWRIVWLGFATASALFPLFQSMIGGMA